VVEEDGFVVFFRLMLKANIPTRKPTAAQRIISKANGISVDQKVNRRGTACAFWMMNTANSTTRMVINTVTKRLMNQI